jgi:hypothetical protein
MIKNDFELSFPSLTDFLLNENSINKFSVFGINDLPNFQFDRINVDTILIKKILTQLYGLEYILQMIR